MLVAAALFMLSAPVAAEEVAQTPPSTQQEKKDPCGHVKIERNKRICQQNIKWSALDMEMSRLITDINYALKTVVDKKTFEYTQESWSTYMGWSCRFETAGSVRGVEAEIDEQNCKIAYMNSRIKHLQKYLGCIGSAPCPEKGN